MSIALTHIVDETTPEDDFRLLSLLLRLLPVSEVRQSLIVVGRRHDALVIPQGAPQSQVGRQFGVPGSAAFNLQRVLERHEPQVVHAWGAAAAAVASVGIPSGLPVVTTMSDPADTADATVWWQRYGGGGGRTDIICSTETVQQRLLTAGIPATSTVLIRPGIDPCELQQAKETIKRTDLDLPPTGRVLLTASPPSRDGGQFFAVWAAAILYQIWPDACLVIPGMSREQDRLRRLIDQIYCPHIFFPVDNQYSPATLLSISDVLIFPAVADVSTYWLACAMAAAVPIAGCTMPAVTELVRDGYTGFLCQPGEPHLLAVAIRTALEAGETTRQCVENSRSQAEHLFGHQRYMDEYLNVLKHANQVH